MNDQTLTEMAARVDPVSPGAWEGLAGTQWGRETLDAIVSSRPGRGRWVTRTATAVAAAAIVAGVVVVTRSAVQAPPPERGATPAHVATARQSPRLLITAPGWRLERAEDYGDDGGETSFRKGRLWVSINWYRAKFYDQYVNDRRRGAERSAEMTIAGHDAFLFRHDGNAPIGVTFYALWFDGSFAVELRTDVIPEESEFREIARSIERVDVDTWLAAMPASVVTPDERQQAIERIVADMDVPPNVDLDALASRQVVTESLEYEVATAVACGWIERWIDADRAGDEAGRREAAEAMAKAHDWDALASNGMWAQYVAGVAEEMADGAPAEGSGSVGDRFRRDIGCGGG